MLTRWAEIPMIFLAFVLDFLLELVVSPASGAHA